MESLASVTSCTLARYGHRIRSNLGSRPTRLVPRLLCGGALFFILGSFILAQATPVQFRVASNLILMDVRISDAEGRPIMGLTAEDFTLLEEGLTQKIGYFLEIALPLTSPRIEVTRSQPVARRSEEVQGSPQLTVPDKRLLILLFNYSSASLQDIQLMQEATEDFLKEQFTQDDAVAILVFQNGLELLTDFTSDRVLLSQALGRLTRGNPELEVSLPDEDTQSETGSEFIADETEFALFETNQQLSAIQSVTKAFRDVAGRKALLYFSAGLSSRGVENDEQMRWTTDLCNRSNVSVYSVDSRGLVALSPGGGAHRAGSTGTGIFNGRSALNELVGLSESQEGLITLAADTGGAALIDDNDFSKIFQEARQDASHYYLIGYYSPTPPSDGRFRKIEVRSRITHSEMEYRSGYYADRPYRSLSTTERELRLLHTIVEQLPKRDFPLETSAEYFPDSSNQYQVPVLLAFNHSQLRELSGAKELNLEIVMLARDTQKNTRAALRDKVEIRKRVEEEGETRYVYQNLFVLDPGQYQLTVYVRDNRTGLMSEATNRLDLPPVGVIRSSSLVLAGGWKDPSSQSDYRIKIGKHVTIVKNPLEVSSRVLIPRVNAKFTRLETLYLHSKVSTDRPAESGDYRIILLNEARKKLFEGAWRTLVSDPDEGLNVNARLPLGQLQHGKYQLIVEVRLKGGETHLIIREFDVVPHQGTQTQREFQVPGSRFQVPGSRFQVSGSRGALPKRYPNPGSGFFLSLHQILPFQMDLLKKL